MNGLRSPLIAALNKERVTKSLLHANCLIKGRRPSGILEIRYRMLYICCIIQHVHLYHPRNTIYHILIITYLIENDMIDHMQTWLIPIAFCIIPLFTCCPMSGLFVFWEVFQSFLYVLTKYCTIKASKNIWQNSNILSKQYYEYINLISHAIKHIE